MIQARGPLFGHRKRGIISPTAEKNSVLAMRLILFRIITEAKNSVALRMNERQGTAVRIFVNGKGVGNGGMGKWALLMMRKCSRNTTVNSATD
ncbi:MAG: hypothetical protein U1F16_05170 [Turneriella sp.]